MNLFNAIKCDAEQTLKTIFDVLLYLCDYQYLLYIGSLSFATQSQTLILTISMQTVAYVFRCLCDKNDNIYYET